VEVVNRIRYFGKGQGRDCLARPGWGGREESDGVFLSGVKDSEGRLEGHLRGLAITDRAFDGWG